MRDDSFPDYPPLPFSRRAGPGPLSRDPRSDQWVQERSWIPFILLPGSVLPDQEVRFCGGPEVVFFLSKGLAPILPPHSLSPFPDSARDKIFDHLFYFGFVSVPLLPP